MLDSNPTVSSRLYREVPLTSTRSGLRESPVMMLGDRINIYNNMTKLFNLVFYLAL